MKALTAAVLSLLVSGVAMAQAPTTSAPAPAAPTAAPATTDAASHDASMTKEASKEPKVKGKHAKKKK